MAHAAKALDLAPRVHRRTTLGLQVGVGRAVELPPPLTDVEWHRLVADLRETFDARGKLSDQGPFKQWTNGNLQPLLEPSEGGHRLRLSTLEGSAMRAMGLGLAATAISAVVLVTTIASGASLDGSFWTLFIVGVALLVAGVAQVPGWAGTRQRQMEEIIERGRRMVATEPPSTSTDLDRRQPTVPFVAVAAPCPQLRRSPGSS